jgi:flagellar biosynthesis protein FlhG
VGTPGEFELNYRGAVDMTDQARRLRELAWQAARTDSTSEPDRQWVVVGARAAAGATTLTINLALELHRQGWPVAAVDADERHADLLAGCGLVPRYDLSDLARGERTVREVVQTGPGGLPIIGARRSAGDGRTGSPETVSPGVDRASAAGLRILRNSRLAIIDAGLRADTFAAGDSVTDWIVIAPADPPGLLEGYSRIKELSARIGGASLWTVISHVSDEVEAVRAHAKLAETSDRFLNRHVQAAGALPADPRVAEGTRRGCPVRLHAPTCDYCRALVAIATTLRPAREPLRPAAATPRGPLAPTGPGQPGMSRERLTGVPVNCR